MSGGGKLTRYSSRVHSTRIFDGKKYIAESHGYTSKKSAKTSQQVWWWMGHDARIVKIKIPSGLVGYWVYHRKSDRRKEK